MPTHMTTDGTQSPTNKTYDFTAANGNVLTMNAAHTNAAAVVSTTSSTGVHAGLALAFTPRGSGRVMVVFTGEGANSSAITDRVVTRIRYGTGAAPANGAALTGTAAGLPQSSRSDNSLTESIGSHAVITGLTPGTAYWFDVSQACLAVGTVTLTNVLLTVVEL